MTRKIGLITGKTSKDTRTSGGGEDEAEIRPDAWMLPDRVAFSDWITETFTYDDTDNDGLFVRQRFVRDYLQPASPYAGLLLYHAVGVGKSRASIAALRALEDKYKIFVLIPAFVRATFMDELRKFGGKKYAENQRWARNPDAGGEWQPVSEEATTVKGVSFHELPDADKQAVRTKLTKLIEKDIRFIHYNGGITQAVLDEMHASRPNPFEGAAIVIDEAHNFISSVTKGGLARHLYERIMDAEDRKLVMLSGTPFVNRAIEMPYMLNILHGYVRTLLIDVEVNDTKGYNKKQSGIRDISIVQDDIRRTLEETPVVNRFEFDYSHIRKGVMGTKTNGSRSRGRWQQSAGGYENDKDDKGERGLREVLRIVVQLVPSGFHRVSGRAESERDGLSLSGLPSPGRDGDGKADDNRAFVQRIISPGDLSSPSSPSSPSSWVESARREVVHRLRQSTGQRVTSTTDVVPLFPVGDAFIHRFTEGEGEKLRKHAELESRSQGLVSYFSAYDKEAFPERSVKNIVTCPMSAHQFDVYKSIREEEHQQEKFKRFKPKGDKAKGKSPSSLSSVSSEKDVGNYRMSSRQVCTFAFPENLPRPYKKHVKAITMVDESNTIDTNQHDEEEKGQYDDGDEEDVNEDGGKEVTRRPSAPLITKEYRKRLTKTMDMLRRAPQFRDVLDVEGNLAQHSPKMYRMLRHFATRRVPMLVYSEFRSIEGVGVLAACLDANGYTRLSVVRDSDTGQFRLKESAPLHPSPRSPQSPSPSPSPSSSSSSRYMIFDNVDKEAASILKSVFNSEFDRLPRSVIDDVNALFPTGEDAADGNLHGNLAKIMMVTKSGAEGISLKNVREVHLMEPFWNENRVDQVIGRAVRTHSHSALPRHERRVDIYVYMATFTEEQAKQRSIERLDQGKTSDEYLYALALQKAVLTDDMLGIIRRASVDCRLHRREHLAVDPRHRCSARIVGRMPDDFSYALSSFSSSSDDQSRSISKANAGTNSSPSSVSSSSSSGQGKGQRVLKAVRIKGVSYYMDPSSRELFDYESIKQRGELVPITLANSKNGEK